MATVLGTGHAGETPALGRGVSCWLLHTSAYLRRDPGLGPGSFLLAATHIGLPPQRPRPWAGEFPVGCYTHRPTSAETPALGRGVSCWLLHTTAYLRRDPGPGPGSFLLAAARLNCPATNPTIPGSRPGASAAA